MKGFKEFIKWMEEACTDTGQIAVFARPFITGNWRMYPEPVTIDGEERKKKHERKNQKDL